MQLIVHALWQRAVDPSARTALDLPGNAGKAQPIAIPRGEPLSLAVTVWDDLGRRVDLTGLTVRLRVRLHPLAGDTASAVSTADPANLRRLGRADLSLTLGRGVLPGRYQWDLHLETDAGSYSILPIGPFTVLDSNWP